MLYADHRQSNKTDKMKGNRIDAGIVYQIEGIRMRPPRHMALFMLNAR